jgi:hypothetical protein
MKNLSVQYRREMVNHAFVNDTSLVNQLPSFLSFFPFQCAQVDGMMELIFNKVGVFAL